MTNAIRAAYEQGHLRLLEPVDLFEGQQIEIMIQEPPVAKMPNRYPTMNLSAWVGCFRPNVSSQI